MYYREGKSCALQRALSLVWQQPRYVPYLVLLAACGGSASGSPEGLADASDVGVADVKLSESGVNNVDSGGSTAKEVCDGLDNNANGRVDEGCSCKAGATQACYPGLAANRNVGECKDGSQSCKGAGEFGVWGDCVGAALPKVEITDGKDNDCNGKSDDLCSAGGSGKPETCGNALDDDCDGLIDCVDPDCPVCVEKNCHDKMDNDSDGLTDCLDPDCPPCNEKNCHDALDNDGDGYVDCKDPDCPPCGETQCSNGLDDDKDGLADCQDSDCPACNESQCNNSLDDDQDGLVDCKDPDCPPCTELCADGVDNDSDGLVDCKDPDCPACDTEKLCNDGVDNDHDGTKDCEDIDCASASNCQAVCSGGECCNGLDDNANGKIDEGDVCINVGADCPPGAIQSCDCYCGVHRRCTADGTWGPCLVDSSCEPAEVTTQSECSYPRVCDYGKCVDYTGTAFQQGTECTHHNDCPLGKVCDLGKCISDHYTPQCQAN